MHTLTLALLVGLASCENQPSPPPTAPSQPQPQPQPQPSVAVIDATPVADAGTPVTTPTPAPTGDITKLARSNNAFGFDLYARVRKDPGNVVVSPASLTTALAMTWAGARGDTAAQMQRVLHLAGTPDEVSNAAGALAKSLEDPSRPIKFRIANRLFGEKTYAFEQPYIDRTAAGFGAPLERLDFAGGAAAARTHINEWVESKTEKRIVDLLPPDGVDKDTRLVLVNALYFLGDWETPFEAQLTRPQPFHVAKTTTKPVPTMNKTSWYQFARGNGVSAIELPYKGGSMSMLLVVPDAVDGLPAVEATFDAAKLDAIVGSLKSERVWLQMPKFTVAPAKSMSLRDHLVAMGMPLAFDRRKADFTGIANPKNPEDRLVIAKVFHKTFVKVDEKGTEAAAATAVSMAKAGAAPAKPTELVVDRPFLFVIRDTATNLVLFVGRVADPTAS